MDDAARQFTYACVPSSPEEFVDFWAKRYPDVELDERLYAPNISGPKTPEALRELFAWKAGKRFFSTQLPTLEKNFIDRSEKARSLPPDVSAEVFLAAFPSGGAIYRIFWLHCWHPNRFPIYDQHVYRAMKFMQTGRTGELGGSDSDKIESYRQYIKFYRAFSFACDREVDRALWTFGKYIKSPMFPIGEETQTSGIRRKNRRRRRTTNMRAGGVFPANDPVLGIEKWPASSRG